jgi:hypothetical protein
MGEALIFLLLRIMRGRLSAMSPSLDGLYARALP